VRRTDRGEGERWCRHTPGAAESRGDEGGGGGTDDVEAVDVRAGVLLDGALEEAEHHLDHGARQPHAVHARVRLHQLDSQVVEPASRTRLYAQTRESTHQPCVRAHENTRGTSRLGLQVAHVHEHASTLDAGGLVGRRLRFVQTDRACRLDASNVSRQRRVSGSPRSGEISTKVGVDSALRNMVVKGGSQRQITFMGV